jgi:histidyl-tRNA synthetase
MVHSMFNRIKGTQDFLDLTLFNFLVDKAKKHVRSYNFSQIITPVLEPTELFKRSLGAETDVITKEIYTVNTGSDEESICLRPEATAPTVRAFVNNGISTTPWKVFSWGPMFRHERPQKGRYREFNQINMEIIGSSSVMQDAHFIKMLDRFFHEELLLDSYGLLINYMGCSEDRVAYKKALA